MQCQITSVWLRYMCTQLWILSIEQLHTNLTQTHTHTHARTHTHTHTHTHPFHHGSPDILFGLCKKKKQQQQQQQQQQKQICLNTAKIPFRAYNPTYFWKTLDTHVKQITCHLQSTYGGNSVRLCAEIQPERACKSNRWQRVTRLSQRIVGCWGKEERCSLPASEDGNILTASDLRVSHGMQAWLTLCSF